MGARLWSKWTDKQTDVQTLPSALSPCYAKALRSINIRKKHCDTHHLILGTMHILKQSLTTLEKESNNYFLQTPKRKENQKQLDIAWTLKRYELSTQQCTNFLWPVLRMKDPLSAIYLTHYFTSVTTRWQQCIPRLSISARRGHYHSAYTTLTSLINTSYLLQWLLSLNCDAI